MVRLIRLPLLLAVMAMTVSSWATTYYVAANGSDSNSGTSMSSPFRHAPEMQNCSANCLKLQNGTSPYAPRTGGDRFIFRGGDTWYHTLAGQSEDGSSHAVGLQWNWNASGSSGSYIYIGVDNSTANASGSGTTGWYNPAVCGSSWCRPILDGGNPLSTSMVASCVHPFGQGTRFFNNGSDYVQFDNFDLRGVCWNSGNYNPAPTYIAAYSRATYSNLYIHGWTHTSGASDGVTGIIGPTGPSVISNTYSGLVCDGSDSHAASFTCIYGDIYDLHNSVLRYNANGAVGDCHTVHDNLFEYITESWDASTHSNVFECNNAYNGANYYYNNLIRHITTAVTAWTCARTIDYIYNNIEYDIAQQGWDLAGASSAPCQGGGVVYFYNNTMVSSGADLGPLVSGSILSNNVWIDNAAPSGNFTQTGSVSYTLSQATAAGFTMNNNYQPTSSNCNGTSPCPVANGLNQSSVCASTPGSTLCKDTTAGVRYDPVNHMAIYPGRVPASRPTGTIAWDAGAFLYSAGVVAGPTPPSSLSAVVQ